jgi:hypothetical protein
MPTLTTTEVWNKNATMYDLGADESKGLLALYSAVFWNMAILFKGHVSSPFSPNSRQWRPFFSTHKSHKPRPSSTTHQLPHDPKISYPILIKESQIRLNSRGAAAVDSHTQGSETGSRPEMFTESFISLCITSIVRRSEDGSETFHNPKSTLPNYDSQICFEGSYSAQARGWDVGESSLG